MRIAHLIDYFQPAIGYQETYIAREQQARGHEVHIVTSDRYFPFPDYDSNVGKVLGRRIVGAGTRIEGGLTVHRLPCWLELPRIAQVAMRGIAAKIAELRPDVVNCDGVLSYQAWQIARLKRRLGFGLVYDNHAEDFNTNLHGSLLKRVAYDAYRRIMLPDVRAAGDFIAAIGEGSQAFVCRELGLQPEKVPVLPLGADTLTFAPNPVVRAQTRMQLGVRAETVLIIHAGKLTAKKDVDVLLRAVAQVRASRPVWLMIVGGGNDAYLKRLREIARACELESRILWQDFVPAHELVRFLNAADLGIWPGNLSNVIQEAVATGLPVIVADHCSETATGDHLVANDNGRMFRRGDADDLARVITSLVDDPIALGDMRPRSRELAERAFSYNAIASQFLALYEQAIGKQTGGGSEASSYRRRSGFGSQFGGRRSKTTNRVGGERRTGSWR